MRFALVRSLTLFAFVVLVRSAPAGIINLTSGSFEPTFVTGSFIGGPVHFEGDRGFTFDGTVGGDEGSSVTGCFFCQPGTPIHLSAAAFPIGTATLDGLSFTVRSVHDPGPNNLEFHTGVGEVVAPPFDGSSTTALRVPLTFSGFFDHLIDPAVGPPAGGGTTIDTLVGDASATLTLSRVSPPFSDESTWHPTDIVYNFGPTTTPEPSSLLLLGSGVVALVGKRAWRNRS